jgi:hypothetical protein
VVALQRRQALLVALRAERQHINCNLNSQGDQARLSMVRRSLIGVVSSDIEA